MIIKKYTTTIKECTYWISIVRNIYHKTLYIILPINSLIAFELLLRLEALGIHLSGLRNDETKFPLVLKSTG